MTMKETFCPKEFNTAEKTYTKVVKQMRGAKASLAKIQQ